MLKKICLRWYWRLKRHCLITSIFSHFNVLKKRNLNAKFQDWRTLRFQNKSDESCVSKGHFRCKIEMRYCMEGVCGRCRISSNVTCWQVYEIKFCTMKCESFFHHGGETARTERTRWCLPVIWVSKCCLVFYPLHYTSDNTRSFLTDSNLRLLGCGTY